MDHPRLSSRAGEDRAEIPDDLRCKRSDGKQWRCTAMSMPDKTVCEKHYIQAKKRAANSALRASMKKANRKSVGQSDIYFESKDEEDDDDDMDLPLVNHKMGDHSGSISGKKHKVAKAQTNYLAETSSAKNFSTRNSLKSGEELQVDSTFYEESHKSDRTPPLSAMESSKSRSQKMFDSSPVHETSNGSSNSSDNTGGQPCHHCRRNHHRVIWCLKCDRRGYCESCLSTWYSDFLLEEVQRACPACRGSCNCKVCLRGEKLIKGKIREIPPQDKLLYLYSLLNAVLPVVNGIHHDQCTEVELERKLRGNDIDLARTKLNADEQMCCDFCRVPIVDYHRHCPDCSYDLCLSCCKDIREASTGVVKGNVGNEDMRRTNDKGNFFEEVSLSNIQLNFFKTTYNWKANSDGSILCPPKESGGCGSAVLTLKRIFKMNWVAKLVKNVEEMVNGCKVSDVAKPERSGFDLRLSQAAHRENDSDNCLYHPSSEDIKNEGIDDFRKHWSRGEPVIIKDVCDGSSMSIWDPAVIWKGIRETTEEKANEDHSNVKAIDCFDWTEVNIELGQFIQGYSEGKIRENGWPQMLRLKDWPSPTASEEFLMYQRTDFISKIPLLEFIHCKWGLLNVAAKLPHYSLQNDVGPKILISYGMYDELGRGDSVNNLHINMRDMAYLLVHTCEVKVRGLHQSTLEMVQKSLVESNAKEFSAEPYISVNGREYPRMSYDQDGKNEYEACLDSNDKERIEDQGFDRTVNYEDLNKSSPNSFENFHPGALWDVFRRQDVPKLIEYLMIHKNDFWMPENVAPRLLYDGVIYLNKRHKRQLKEEFGIEPWSFEQHLGEAVFIPAGCAYQVRNIQSTVQLGLDFLSPESLGESVKLAEEIRGLPNDHDLKLQMLEVGKISLYAASSAGKEAQKLVLDPKLGAELGFEDPNLTAMVSENLEKMIKRRQIACA